MIRHTFASAYRAIRNSTHYYLGATVFGLGALLTLGCDDSTGSATPVTGTIEITVSTASADIDIDPDGYTLSIDGRPGQAVGVNAVVTIGSLPSGKHLVQLHGLAPNCSVGGSNPRSVDVITDEVASAVTFSVSCIGKSDTGAGEWDY
jgi:hypothetical protein